MGFEIDIIIWLQNFRSVFTDAVFEFFTMFGEEEILIVLLGYIYWCYDKKLGELLGITIFISLGLNSFLKLIIARPRPFMVDNRIVNVRPSTSGGYSLPSGHTQTAATTYFSLYFNTNRKRIMLILAIVITTLVAISRMYLGVHYLTDVLLGGALGIGLAYGFSRVSKNKELIKNLYKYLLWLTLVALVGLTIYYVLINIDELGNFDSDTFILGMESLAKMMGTLFGFCLAIIYEDKKVKFVNHKNIKNNIIRFVLGITIILATRFALKFIFGIIVDAESSDLSIPMAILAILLDFIRYFAMLFIGIGLYPKLFKKFNI
jgi:membrane-associated phospholipid phosphatase